MAVQIAELAQLVSGHVVGDATIHCHGANPLGVATPNDITMLDDPSRSAAIAESCAVAIVTKAEIDCSECSVLAQIIVDDPHAAFTKIVGKFRPPIETSIPGVGVDSSTAIAASAKVHPNATIAAGTSIGERSVIMPGVVILEQCKIGDDCVIHPNVTLYPYTELGDRVVLHAGTVIGANGFGYRQENGRHIPTAQLGYVKIESDVEIGAGTAIDRGTYGATVIGEGTKIDNLVQIAHNCHIGKHNILCSQVGIAGSCKTGDYVIMAGQVGIKDHILIGDHTIIGAQSGVMNDCKSNEVYLGSPAVPQRDQMQSWAIQRKLPDIRREVRKLRKELDQVKTPAAGSTDSQKKHAGNEPNSKRAA